MISEQEERLEIKINDLVYEFNFPSIQEQALLFSICG